MDPINQTLRELNRKIFRLAMLVLVCMMVFAVSGFAAAIMYADPTIPQADVIFRIALAVGITFGVIGGLAYLAAKLIQRRYQRLIQANFYEE